MPSGALPNDVVRKVQTVVVSLWAGVGRVIFVLVGRARAKVLFMVHAGLPCRAPPQQIRDRLVGPGAAGPVPLHVALELWESHRHKGLVLRDMEHRGWRDKKGL